jgi:hypothetical protein
MGYVPGCHCDGQRNGLDMILHMQCATHQMMSTLHLLVGCHVRKGVCERLGQGTRCWLQVHSLSLVWPLVCMQAGPV